MRLIEFLNTVNLFEAAKDRYAQMFTNLIPMFNEIGKEHEYETTVNQYIDWAMSTLKKEDKIIWFLRFAKVSLLDHMAKPSSPETLRMNPGWAEKAEKFKLVYQKAVNQLAKKMGVSPDSAAGSAELATSDRFKRQMDHFMSLELPALEQYVFSNQSPEQITQDWTPIETAWQAKRGSLIDIDRDDVDTLIEYPDGSEWVNLNKNYCREEGEAMGHCGNSASYDEDHTVLSYRTIEETEKGKMWKPRLTFILDTKTGLLGETKGRANQKPSEKYHKVIVDLLRLDIVKGIKGGGYEAENNFHFEDLPDDVQEELVEEKPGLASIAFDYKKRGMTNELRNRMEAMWEETETKFPDYNPSNKMFLYPTGSTIQQFVSNYGGDQAEYVMDILTGEKHMDIWFDGAPTDDLWTELPPKIQQAVGEWLIENHADAVEEWKEDNDTDYDGTDAGDTWSIMHEHDIEEVEDALKRGIMVGYERGAEDEMSKSMDSWITDLETNREFELAGLHPGNDWSDTDQLLMIPEETMINLVSNYIDDIAYQGDFIDFFEFKKLEAPYNGWEGYDEEAAIEHATEQLHEEGVLG